jgi:hypothetical protein
MCLVQAMVDLLKGLLRTSGWPMPPAVLTPKFHWSFHLVRHSLPVAPT